MEKTKILQTLDACNQFLALNGFEHPLSAVIGRHRQELIFSLKGDSSVDILMSIVAQETQVPIDLIRGENRLKYMVTDARHLFCKLAKEELKMSLKDIGLYLSGRDHSTIHHSLKAADDLIFTNAAYRNTYKNCKQLFKVLYPLASAEPATVTEVEPNNILVSDGE